jgi:hypothetical protein
VLVIHDREEAFRLADHLVVLDEGRVLAAGSKGAVYARPPDRVTAELLGYTVLRCETGLIAVPPGALRPGDGHPELWMEIERVVDMGNHRHAIGRVGGERVDLRLPDGHPDPTSSERLRIAAGSCVPLPEPE